MESRIQMLRLLILLLALVLFTGCSRSNRREVAENTPVIIITLDTTRADRLGCYGSDRGLTPFLDSFAERATVFSRCEASVPLTLPSHTTIFSGLNPIRHGLQVNMNQRVSPEVSLIASAFKRAGYSTSAFISASVLLKRYGLDRDFDIYDQSFFGPKFGDFQRASAETTLSKVETWMPGHEKDPFFLWVHLYDPHYQYSLPAGYREKYSDEPYDGCIAYMDAELGKFFRSAPMNGWENWYVIICGDHGESLGQHKESRHGTLIYDATTLVPLMVHLPGQEKGAKVYSLVGLVDIAPTVRELMGFPEKKQDGVSLVSALEGGKVPARPVFIESLQGAVTYGWAPLFGVVDGKYKYIDAPAPELYDLMKDPREQSNLYGKISDVEKRLRGDLERYKALRPVGEARAESLSEEEQGQLAGLGYLQGGFSVTGTSKRDPKHYVDLEDDFMSISLAFIDKDYKTVKILLDKIEKRDPEDPYLYFNKGKLLEVSSVVRASECYRKAVFLAPSYGLAWSMWIRLKLNNGDIDEAAEIAKKAASRCPDSRGYFAIALAEEAFMKDRSADDIRSYITDALSADPNMARAHMVSLVLNIREGNNDMAREDIGRVWGCASKDEVDSWQKDPVFRSFFEARPPS